MKLLLDTHALLWWFADDRRLGREVRDLLADPEMVVQASVVSLWESVIKLRIGKLKVDIAALQGAIVMSGMVQLAILPEHLAMLTTLPSHHRDPFDHLLIAQAISEGATLVSNDAAFSPYPVASLRCDG